MKKAVAILAIIFVVILCSVIGYKIGYYRGRKHPISAVNNKTDTLIVYRTYSGENALKSKVDFKKWDIVVPTVLYCHDTTETEKPVIVYKDGEPLVKVPLSEHFFQSDDKRLRVWTTGYNVTLDRWEYDAPTTTITKTKEAPRFSFGVSAGLGVQYGVFSRKVDFGPSVLVGVSYRF